MRKLLTLMASLICSTVHVGSGCQTCCESDESSLVICKHEDRCELEKVPSHEGDLPISDEKEENN